MMNNRQILFHPGNCLNNKKPYPRECRQCLQYCPHGAISESKEIAKEKCTECGVCMAVCPSDGLVDRDIDNLGEYLFHSQKLILHCPMAQPDGYEISCLGLFDRDAWITMLLLAESQDLKILTGDCGACDDRPACVVSVASFKEILSTWKKQPNIKIEIYPFDENKDNADGNGQKAETNQRYHGQSMGLREKGKSKLKELFPAIEAEETYSIPKTRQWLAKALSREPEKKVPYKALKAGDKCTSCGICAKICPQQALTQLQKDGKARLTYKPLQCVQCKRCVDICGPSNLRFEVVDLSERLLTGKILLSESVSKHCNQCGKQIFHNMEPSLCMPCAAKDPSLKGILY